jgi:phage shock protein PspC (stress-responsive transcriptional regulator)
MKKLYRLEEGKKAAGICNGIADMFNFDVTLVRLVFIFATVFTQFIPGIITYLIGWYIIPLKDDIDKG